MGGWANGRNRRREVLEGKKGRRERENQANYNAHNDYHTFEGEIITMIKHSSHETRSTLQENSEQRVLPLTKAHIK